MFSRGAAAGILLTIISCGSQSQVPAGANVQELPPGEVTLRAGEERAIAGARIAFLAVQGESRCPADVQCVWEGDATAVVRVSPATGEGPSHELRLHTTVDPKSGDALGLRVTLVSLAPVPRSAQPTRPEDYVVKLEVRRP